MARAYYLLEWLIPPVLLVGAALLYASKCPVAWTRVLTIIVATGVAGLQISVAGHSMRGQSWAPGFRGVKLGVLAVLVVVDLAVVWSSLRLRSGVVDDEGRTAGVGVCEFLLILGAFLHLVGFFFLVYQGNG